MSENELEQEFIELFKNLSESEKDRYIQILETIVLYGLATT